MILSYMSHIHLCKKKQQSRLWKQRSITAWDCYHHSGELCFGGGPDLGQQLCHLLLSSDNGWHETIRPADLEEKRRVQMRNGEVKKRENNREENRSQVSATSACVFVCLHWTHLKHIFTVVFRLVCHSSQHHPLNHRWKQEAQMVSQMINWTSHIYTL